MCKAMESTLLLPELFHKEALVAMEAGMIILLLAMILPKKTYGSGTYSINLAGALSASTGDLNLYKLASNYLVDVPLLDGLLGILET